MVLMKEVGRIQLNVASLNFKYNSIVKIISHKLEIVSEYRIASLTIMQGNIKDCSLVLWKMLLSILIA